MYDLVVIGAGWAGFNGCLKARSLGLRVALAEQSQIGGTCLNAGCIPTKTLLASCGLFESFQKASSFGIEGVGQPRLDLGAIQSRKDKIIRQLQSGMRSRLEGIDIFNGQAAIVSERQVRCHDALLDTKAILIATGSAPRELAGFAFDNARIISSDQALALDHVPASLLIIGGGVIGCEFACLFADLGCRVTVVEMTAQLVPGLDQEIAKRLENALRRKRITVLTATSADTLDRSSFEKILVCVGRKPRLPDMTGLGITLAKGRIVTDEFLRTSVPTIFAAGDCTSELMLAHFAGYQGALAAHNIAAPGNPRRVDARAVAGCIFTHPEVAFVGLQESQAQAAGVAVKVYRFDLLGSGMARVLDEAGGLFKIVVDAKDATVRGGSLIGPRSCELISILTLAVQSGMPLEQLKATIFAHPTISEAIGEAVHEQPHG